jgi:hypothetical protein
MRTYWCDAQVWLHRGESRSTQVSAIEHVLTGCGVSLRCGAETAGGAPREVCIRDIVGGLGRIQCHSAYPSTLRVPVSNSELITQARYDVARVKLMQLRRVMEQTVSVAERVSS